MKIILDGQTLDVARDATFLDAARALYPDDPYRVLGIAVGGRTLPLGAPVDGTERASCLSVYTEEGRRIYERSLRFVLLLAIRQLFPAARVRIENSTQSGVYLTASGMPVNQHTACQIEARMRELVASDLPYHKTVVTRKEAIQRFAREGQTDKVRLLTYRPYEHFSLYECGGLLEYFYGEMAPSTGYTPVFALRFQMPGLELKLPSPDDPSRPAPFADSPKLMRTFRETARWANILGCENVADLNEMIDRHSLREFIRVNEALHEKSIGDVADAIVKSGARLVLIAGPSSSGKTTFAHRLAIQLRVLGLRPVKVSLDDYYADRSNLPLEADGQPDFEKLEALDVPLFNSQIVPLLQGEEIEMPLFDFKAAARKPVGRLMKVETDQPIIIEGIHALNERLTQHVPRDQKFLIYISALTTLNLDDHNRIRTTDTRLIRRVVRDNLFRGTPPEGTLAMWDKVRNGERKYILPHQESADVMFNSSLVYELSVLKKYAYPLLAAVPPQNAYFTRAQRLLKFLNYFETADVENEIPLNSILREFIGGCCFYREED